jgi:hypothetical protein
MCLNLNYVYICTIGLSIQVLCTGMACFVSTLFLLKDLAPENLL